MGQIRTMKLQITILLTLAVFAMAGRRRGKGKGGRGRNITGNKVFHHAIAQEAHQCFRDDCWGKCFTEACQDCKSECINLHEGDRKSKRKCLRQCKENSTCPKKFKGLPKDCRQCKKTCFKTAIMGSSAAEWIEDCSGACNEICWGPLWKTEGCKGCVAENCNGDDDNELREVVKSGF